MKHLGKNGELVSKEELIAEIEGLLNRLDSRANIESSEELSIESRESSSTRLSPEVMSALEFDQLESIRDGLLKKSSSVVEDNIEWLKGLVQ